MSDVMHRQIILLHAHLVLQSAFRVRAWLCETRFPAARRGIQLILRVSLKIHSLLWTDNQFTCQKSAVSNCSHLVCLPSFCLRLILPINVYHFTYIWVWLRRAFKGQDWLWFTLIYTTGWLSGNKGVQGTRLTLIDRTGWL